MALTAGDLVSQHLAFGNTGALSECPGVCADFNVTWDGIFKGGHGVPKGDTEGTREDALSVPVDRRPSESVGKGVDQ